MREALTTHQRFGCRIFVIALADRKRIFDGGKIGTWAATLDELARELDVELGFGRCHRTSDFPLVRNDIPMLDENSVLDA
jgi:hypothetical protein